MILSDPVIVCVRIYREQVENEVCDGMSPGKCSLQNPFVTHLEEGPFKPVTAGNPISHSLLLWAPSSASAVWVEPLSFLGTGSGTVFNN